MKDTRCRSVGLGSSMGILYKSLLHLQELWWFYFFLQCSSSVSWQLSLMQLQIFVQDLSICEFSDLDIICFVNFPLKSAQSKSDLQSLYLSCNVGMKNQHSLQRPGYRNACKDTRSLFQLMQDGFLL